MFTKAVFKTGYKNHFILLFSAVAISAQISSIPLVPDSSAVPADKVPQTELIDIDASSAFTRNTVHVGDTLSYVLTVEWQNPKVPFTVLAPESLTFEGFKRRTVSTQHRKHARTRDGEPVLINQSEFRYQLEAALPGPGRASSASLPYFSALSRDKEYFQVPPQHIDILPAPTPIFKRWYVISLIGIMVLLLVWLGAKAAITRFSRRKKSQTPVLPDFQAKLTALKPRLANAESKTILLEMEALCITYLKQLHKRTGSCTFQSLLKIHLPGETAESKSAWGRLEKDFELAKFGGGQKAPHELAETYQALKTCLKTNAKGKKP